MGLFRGTKRGASTLKSGEFVAYFCAEYAITDLLPIYSGGLGVLAGDIVQEAAERNLPFVAVGLFYKKGYFHQCVDEDGQNEYTKVIDPRAVPLELVCDATGETLLIEVPISDKIVFAQVWKYTVGSISLYLLDTDHWKNSEVDRTITDQLYEGDHSKRIQQEMVLGIGGYRALQQLGIKPTLYHMNEGHSAFLSLELIHHYHEDKNGHGPSLEKAQELARQHLVFTNHTLVPAGNDAFPHDSIRFFLGKYAFDNGVNIEAILNLGNSPEQPGTFSMTYLAMRMSRKSNAVSRLHAEKARGLWPDQTLLPVTNGVHMPAWIAPEMQRLFDQHVPNWRTYMSDAGAWKGVRRIPVDELWAVHQVLKARMLDEVYARTGVQMDQDTLTIVWARRFASYKRPDLLFSDVNKLKHLIFSSDRPIQIIVAGKAHPGDEQGKQIIDHINDLANFDLKHRAVFVDDYSITLAKTLVAGADVWLNTPIYGLEASGTSGMKAAANGVIACTTPDGWAYEVDWYGMGFTLPIETEKATTDIYTIFEKKIVPAYYRVTSSGVPDLWVAMMKESIAALTPRFSSQRMVNDYIEIMYAPGSD